MSALFSPANRQATNLVRLSLAIVLLGCPRVNAQEAQPPEPMSYQEICFRETSDQVWELKFSGNIPSMAGCYAVVHNAQGRIIAMHHVPHGVYAPDSPFTVEIPKDGITGDYRLVIVGSQQDMLGIELPVSDLKNEVYGTSAFGKNGKGPLWFKAAPEVKELFFSGHRGTMNILDASGQVLAETAPSPEFKDYMTVATVAVEPGKIYGIQPVTSFYMNVGSGTNRQRIDVAFDPDRLFNPDPELQNVRWWRVTDQPLESKPVPQ